MTPLRWLFFAVCLTVTGCAAFTAGRPGGVGGAKIDLTATSVESLLDYYVHARTLSASDWSSENERLRSLAGKSTDKDIGEARRLRHVLLAMAPAAPTRERARALPLLEQLARDAQKTGSRLLGLIVMLRVELSERHRLEEKLSEEMRRADEMEQKLNELMLIEKNLLERNRPLSPAAPKKRRIEND